MGSGGHYRPRIGGHARCIECCEVFCTTRKDARFCSARCRQSNSRRNRLTAMVKDKPVSALASVAERKQAINFEPVNFYTGAPPFKFADLGSGSSSPATGSGSSSPAKLVPVTDIEIPSQKSALVPMPAIAAAKVKPKKSVTARPHTSKSVTPTVRGKKSVTAKKKSVTGKAKGKPTAGAKGKGAKHARK